MGAGDHPSQQTFDQLYAQGREVERVLNGYINYLKRESEKVKSGKEKRGKGVHEETEVYEVEFDIGSEFLAFEEDEGDEAEFNPWVD